MGRLGNSAITLIFHSMIHLEKLEDTPVLTVVQGTNGKSYDKVVAMAKGHEFDPATMQDRQVNVLFTRIGPEGSFKTLAGMLEKGKVPVKGRTVTLTSDQPFYEGQQPWEETGLYYLRNFALEGQTAAQLFSKEQIEQANRYRGGQVPDSVIA